MVKTLVAGTERGAAVLEVCIICALIIMVCYAAVGRLGMKTGAQFCRPIQAMDFGKSAFRAVAEIDESEGKFNCEDIYTRKYYSINSVF